jgi:hypothetical protein
LLLEDYFHIIMATKSASNDQNTPYILYHNTYSMCSLMVRYTLAVRGAPHSPAAAMTVDEQMLDIFHEAQFDEDFLLNVNPKGQVSGPVDNPTGMLSG